MAITDVVDKPIERSIRGVIDEIEYYIACGRWATDRRSRKDDCAAVVYVIEECCCDCDDWRKLLLIALLVEAWEPEGLTDLMAELGELQTGVQMVADERELSTDWLGGLSLRLELWRQAILRFRSERPVVV